MDYDPHAPAIVARGLVKHFGSVKALDGVDLVLERGTVLGVLGPNGAGKTTTVRVLTTLIRPDAGEARVLGVDVLHDPDAGRRLMGLAGQYAAVDANLTGRENLVMISRLSRLSAPEAKTRADELLERFKLSHAADRQAKTYSGGMRRRLDLAAALVSAPPVLLLDEPTTGLDPRSRNDLWDVIRELVAEGTSVLLTTQYLEEADVLAQNIMVIDSGKVIAEGTATKLKEHFGTSVLELAFEDEVQTAAVRLLLSDDFSLEPPEPGGLEMQVTVEDAVAGTMGVTRILDSAGLVPTRLALREPSLDDVFLALTGHKAEAEPEPAGGKRGRRGRGGKGAS